MKGLVGSKGTGRLDRIVGMVSVGSDTNSRGCSYPKVSATAQLLQRKGKH